MREPKPMPMELKIWAAAFTHTCKPAPVIGLCGACIRQLLCVPYLHRAQLVPLWKNKEVDPVYCTRKLHIIDQQGDQDDVREQSSEVDHLPAEKRIELKSYSAESHF